MQLEPLERGLRETGERGPSVDVLAWNCDFVWLSGVSGMVKGDREILLLSLVHGFTPSGSKPVNEHAAVPFLGDFVDTCENKKGK